MCLIFGLLNRTMLENILVAFSNIPCYFPIRTALQNSDSLTASALIFVSSASFLSHLVENHKHGMPGIGISRQVSYILNRFDVLGCIMVGLRFGCLFYSKYGLSIKPLFLNKQLFLFSALSFLFLRISEHDKYNPKLKYLYIPAHCIWHISIFTIMNNFLTDVIY